VLVVRKLVLLTVLSLAAEPGWPAETTAAQPPRKKSVASAKKRSKGGRPAAPKPGVAKTPSKAPAKTPAKGSTGKKTRGRRTVKRPTRVTQQAPTPERYKQIEQALAEKGYFPGNPEGKWGPESVDALKRFQQGQNLSPTGKLDSLSLIALGLGPKRTAQAKPQPSPAGPALAR
jgi:hypothetical protein